MRITGSLRLSPLDENHMTSPSGNKPERKEYPEPRVDSVFFLPTLDQIEFHFVVQEFSKMERLSEMGKEDGN